MQVLLPDVVPATSIADRDVRLIVLVVNCLKGAEELIHRDELIIVSVSSALSTLLQPSGDPPMVGTAIVIHGMSLDGFQFPAGRLGDLSR